MEFDSGGVINSPRVAPKTSPGVGVTSPNRPGEMMGFFGFCANAFPNVIRTSAKRRPKMHCLDENHFRGAGTAIRGPRVSAKDGKEET